LPVLSILTLTTPALAFWRNIAVCFAERLTHLPDLEAVRDKATVTAEDDDVRQWLAVAPLCPGAEYFSRDLLLQVWSTLLDTFRRHIRTYDGTVEAFIHAYRPTLQLAGRVFFHLVENTKGGAPFAFLATYATSLGGDGTSRHVPLKYALQEYGNDRDKLLDLLGTVYRAARDSALLPHPGEWRNLSPLGWEPQQAYTFSGSATLRTLRHSVPHPQLVERQSAGARLQVNIGYRCANLCWHECPLNRLPSLSSRRADYGCRSPPTAAPKRRIGTHQK
jgi:non-specific serine/threonine protein kinase